MEPRLGDEAGTAPGRACGPGAAVGPGTEIGLYLHVPFCASICPYCDFARVQADAALGRRYVEAVVREIAGAGPIGPADTIYVGGGTPSLLPPADVGRLVDACRGAAAVGPAAEVTLEANPDSVTLERLAGYRAAGVNRLSLGVQSFRDEELRRLGRRHDAARARAAVAEARAAGFDNVSLDLMIGLPDQRLADLPASIDALVALEPEHASVYLLEIHTGTPLARQIARHRWRQAPDDEAAEMYLSVFEQLERAGLQQYEISSAARPGRASRHNLKYWTGGEWIGFGPAAHSTRGGFRWQNVAGVRQYVSRVEAGRLPDEGRRVLSRREQLEEALFLGLRLADGLDLAAVERRFGVDVGAEYGYRLSPYFDAGLLASGAGRLRLTRHGMLLANEVLSVFLDAPSAKP